MKSIEFEVDTKFGKHSSRLEFEDSASQSEIDLAIKNHVDKWVAELEKISTTPVKQLDPSFDPFSLEPHKG